MQLAGFRMSNEAIRTILGEPHYTETDCARTFGGNEDHWYFTSDSGQYFHIVSRISYETVMLYGDKHDLNEILAELNLPADLTGDGSRFETYIQPCRV